MAVDHIRYDLLAQEALRGMVRTVLVDAAKNGLPGEHHFYISFNTRADGVRLSPRMLAQWPQEMTVVMQHQFWDLVVTDDAFEVGLAFGGVPERLVVPFAAVTSFVDPSVEFGLKFEQIGDASKEQEEPAAAAKDRDTKDRDGKDRERARPPAEHKPARKPPALAAAPAPANPEAVPTPSGGKDKSPASGEVVRLDRFRKK
jgi:hypothetical protein